MIDSVSSVTRRTRWMTISRLTGTTVSAAARALTLCAVLCAATACHGLLDASDPAYIRDQDVANTTGAEARRAFAVSSFMQMVQTSVYFAGLFSDELTYDVTPSPLEGDASLAIDQRRSDAYYNYSGNTDDDYLSHFVEPLVNTSLAIPQIRQYALDNVRRDELAQLFAMRGYTILQMAEEVCPGFPINDVTSDNKPILSDPYTTDEAIAYAMTQLDSALADVRDSAQFLNFARVVKARALLDLGQYDAAAAAVDSVPTSFVFATDPGAGNPFRSFPRGDGTYFGRPPMSDREGTNGLAFISENDTIRAPFGYKGQREAFPSESLFVSLKYPRDGNIAIALASGIEARLIESEVALHNNDASWLTILNDLRTPAGLDPLADPGSAAARVDLIYHERAFWLYLTGRRLGDLRRLIRNYGRAASAVFPVGAYPLGDVYGNETAIAFNLAAESSYNTKITSGCTTP